ncbi:MAG: hypothetical protein A2X94_15835 [Bdellovibrionales bacterium GWB1_55_8]|nr:MAG: hypothetical protein A2X94_15835 [Bdellovibrionales bacterium GWB1_55_8]
MIEPGKLTYLLAEKKSILVVSFIGPLVRTNAHVLEKCIKEISKREATWVIVNFRDVPANLDRTVYPALARLQQVIRSKPAELKMTALHPELRKQLDQQGLLRPKEVVDNLAIALQAVVASAMTPSEPGQQAA